MKLEIPEAIHLLLALPAHRSSVEAHRMIGKVALEQLLDYVNNAKNETEKAYNKAMVAVTLSAVRAFSVERDRIANVWKTLDAIKERRERLIKLFRYLSPLSPDNYWSKAIVVITSIGFSLGKSWPNPNAISFSFTIWLIVMLVSIEMLTRFAEYGVTRFFEKRLPLEKQQSWQKQSILKYTKLVEQFIEEAFEIHKRFYPNEKLLGISMNNGDDLKNLKEELIDQCFYLKE